MIVMRCLHIIITGAMVNVSVVYLRGQQFTQLVPRQSWVTFQSPLNELDEISSAIALIRLRPSNAAKIDVGNVCWLLAAIEVEGTEKETVAVTPQHMTLDSSGWRPSIVLRIRSEDNENYEASRLSHEDFILIAILAGGNCSDGLRKRGIITALGLACAGLGRQPISGLSGKSRSDSIALLKQWREVLGVWCRSPSHRYQNLAAKSAGEKLFELSVLLNVLWTLIWLDEPNELAFGKHQTRGGNSIRLPRPRYYQSLSLPAGIGNAIDHEDIGLTSPRLDLLARFAGDHFGWDDSVAILTHFADQLFVGLAIRELVGQALATNGSIIPQSSRKL
ncbi:hypothetical protein B0H14DRAFT_2637223 [Mycena olivaceomarginata]|nr:hypothetical protein B0H14DRAFT_2637223 [Mycena olivaceomarginata]